MRQGKKFFHARVFTQKFSRDVMFTPYMNTSLTRRPVFTQEDMQKKKTSRRWNETGEKLIHPRVFTRKFSRDVMFTPYMNTSLTRRPVFRQEDMQKKKTSRRWNETGEKFIHARVFTQKFSRDVMFTPYMNTSLTRRPVFTQEDMQKQETSRRWNETGGKIHSRESFHTKVFTGRYVYSLYEYKSHKETCIHTRRHAKEENLEKVE